MIRAYQAPRFISLESCHSHSVEQCGSPSTFPGCQGLNPGLHAPSPSRTSVQPSPVFTSLKPTPHLEACYSPRHTSSFIKRGTKGSTLKTLLFMKLLTMEWFFWRQQNIVFLKYWLDSLFLIEKNKWSSDYKYKMSVCPPRYSQRLCPMLSLILLI